MLFVFHHIACDDWSLRILFEDVAAAYAGRDIPAARPYSAFAARQRKTNPAYADNLRWWRQSLAGAPEAADLPLDGRRGASTRQPGALVRFHIDSGELRALRAIGLAEDSTLFTTLLAAFFVLLG